MYYACNTLDDILHKKKVRCRHMQTASDSTKLEIKLWRQLSCIDIISEMFVK